MPRTHYVFANKNWEVNRWILILSSLGIFAKLLEIDLSQLDVFGVKLGDKNAALIPGAIGLALYYSIAALIVARAEHTLAFHSGHHAEAEQVPTWEKMNIFGKALQVIATPLAFLVYTILPFGVAIYASWYLRHDVVAVLAAVSK